VSRAPGFPQALDDGGTGHLTPGMTLPPIALPATDGKTVNLAKLRGLSLVVVYPWTGRPGLANPPDWDRIPGAHGSTPELEGFRDRHADFAQMDLRLFALSRQDTAYQRELVARLGLPFPILSDAAGAFAAALELPAFATGGTSYLKRLTLLIADGRIERVFYPVVDPAGHAAAIWREAETGRLR
jgi:peroxiredoxin